MYISRKESIVIDVYLRSIVQFAKAGDYGELAYIVSLIEDDLMLRHGAKKLLYSIIDYLIKYNNHEE